MEDKRFQRALKNMLKIAQTPKFHNSFENEIYFNDNTFYVTDACIGMRIESEHYHPSCTTGHEWEKFEPDTFEFTTLEHPAAYYDQLKAVFDKESFVKTYINKSRLKKYAIDPKELQKVLPVFSNLKLTPVIDSWGHAYRIHANNGTYRAEAVIMGVRI